MGQYALVFEQLGLAPTGGRIVARLLLADPPHQSSAELAEYLRASRGAISSSTRQLIQLGLIDRIRVQGDRSSYFRIRTNCWTNLLHDELSRVRRLRELGEQGLQLLTQRGVSDERAERIRSLRDISAFFEGELPRLIERWETA